MKIQSLEKEALNDCWEYHKELLETIDRGNLSKESLKHFLYDIDLEEWEDVGFFIGYLRALDDVKAVLKIKK